MNKLRSLFAIIVFCFSPLAMASLDFEAVFNEPGLKGEATRTLEERFLKLLNMAPAGSEVLLNIYGLKMPYIAEELVKAQERGVKIGVILRNFDDAESVKSLSILKNGLGQCSFGSCLKVCGLACSAPAFNHNKFMLFSKLSDGTENVVVQTSNNFWPSERNNYNDFLILKNNTALYQGLKKYWLTLRKGNKNPGLPVQISPDAKLHIFPKRLIRPHSPALALFRSIKCAPGSIVHLAHSRFTDPRADIAVALADLKRDGCDVKLLIKNDVGVERVGPLRVVGDSPGLKIKRILGDILHLFPYEEGVDGRPYQEGDPIRNALHSKIILIHAPMGDDPAPRKLVVVGTHNFDVPSLKLNNEIMLELSDDKLFDVYHASFDRLLGQFNELIAE